jgi:hypothetical protein
VASLAGQFVAMQVMHQNIGLATCDIFMTRLTAWHSHPAISVGTGLIVYPMEIRSRVAIHTGHPPLAEMNICEQPFMFPQVFIANPAAVAGSTVI